MVFQFLEFFEVSTVINCFWFLDHSSWSQFFDASSSIDFRSAQVASRRLFAQSLLDSVGSIQLKGNYSRLLSSKIPFSFRRIILNNWWAGKILTRIQETFAFTFVSSPSIFYSGPTKNRIEACFQIRSSFSFHSLFTFR